MATPNEQRADEWPISEYEYDVWQRVASYRVEGTIYDIVRTPTGWKARPPRRGRARPKLLGPPCENPRQVVRYLVKFGLIGR
ncbi:hypothetical protein [Sporichthya polymorpha]|uniref:hypothetical protein n=1 Tax=Sporichthya polymorpha TaxID=35751 RepID=UPI00035DFBBF|nr:hypothetical protein [Sporichthya polymorpha]